jgi:hypothetical protein
MRQRMARAYHDGFDRVESVLELDVLTVRQIVEALDPEREDPLLKPWNRRHDAAVRTVLRS